MKKSLLIIALVLLSGCSFGPKEQIVISTKDTQQNISTEKADDLVLIAHRGASKDALENSLEAFAIARSQGVSVIETDVNFTLDGRNIIYHGPSMRLTTCPNSKAMYNRNRSNDLQKCKLINGQELLPLGDFLKKVSSRFSYIIVELKVYDKRGKQQAITAIETVKKLKLEDKVIFITYDVDARKELLVSTGILFARDSQDNSERPAALQSKVPFYMSDFNNFNKNVLDTLKENKTLYAAYTINDTGNFQTLYNEGVRRFLTDDAPLLYNYYKENIQE